MGLCGCTGIVVSFSNPLAVRGTSSDVPLLSLLACSLGTAGTGGASAVDPVPLESFRVDEDDCLRFRPGRRVLIRREPPVKDLRLPLCSSKSPSGSELLWRLRLRERMLEMTPRAERLEELLRLSESRRAMPSLLTLNRLPSGPSSEAGMYPFETKVFGPWPFVCL